MQCFSSGLSVNFIFGREVMFKPNRVEDLPELHSLPITLTQWTFASVPHNPLIRNVIEMIRNRVCAVSLTHSLVLSVQGPDNTIACRSANRFTGHRPCGAGHLVPGDSLQAGRALWRKWFHAISLLTDICLTRRVPRQHSTQTVSCQQVKPIFASSSLHTFVFTYRWISAVELEEHGSPVKFANWTGIVLPYRAFGFNKDHRW